MKIYKYIFIVSVLIWTSSCNDFLEIPPTFQDNSALFYKTPQDFELAIAGAYDGLQSIYNSGQSGGHWIFGDLTTDIAETQSTAGANWEAFSNFLLFSDNIHVELYYNASFNTIYRVNTILSKLDEVELSTEIETQIESEAQFIRGLVYFNLVRIFGDVPLVTKPLGISESFSYLRESKEKVYEVILTDLEYAYQNLPEVRNGNQNGRATKFAAAGLLAKVYLTLGNFQVAANYCKEIIDSNQFKLSENYSDVFSLSFPSEESIFEIQFAANLNGEGSRFFQVFMPQGSINGQGQGYCIPTKQFIDDFEENDLRKDFVIVSNLPGSLFPGSYGAGKYIDPSAGVSDGGNNWIVLRYADVLLMYAEALNKISYGSEQAFLALNDVRSRAGLKKLSQQDLPNQSEFDLAIERERKFELCFEGHRWFDLVRRNRYLEVMNNEYQHPLGITVPETYLLFPIPLSAINVNPNLTQNPGYNL
ncbi:RagB/SusD family nutrient uptake outer membrane protein [Algoriphagus kandeliae]|uniref:RagB/SusD family nutrient uptake outer membrane protein n=1 Tax=Algoriphagus kandeliae TaxID=2562278 RepID=A0A4Y9QYT5_9BACT|nr:RagB/SusD family nutrient uptake outer membrane protein [Algoriphagus kandeliae]TFV97691.1 RagB/SusD family nutrient uptake outer membrane protein [Algoriphagus kandeliae]